MAKNTTNLGLYEKESTDGTDNFNITTMLNENWDKIDLADGTNIKHSLATTANDFIVASGIGAFVKKSLAEVKVILGLGTASHVAHGSSTFNSTTGATITHNIGNTNYDIKITLTSNPVGYLGEVYVTKANNTVTVYCSGSTTTTTFDYIILKW